MRDIILSQYHVAVEKLNFESGQQVNRNNFFMVFQGVIIAGGFQFFGKFESEPLVVAVAFLGVVISLVQSINAAASWKFISTSGRIVVRFENMLADICGGADAEKLLVYSDKKTIARWKVEKVDEVRLKNGISGKFEMWLFLHASKTRSVAKNSIFAAWALLIFWVFILLWATFSFVVSRNLFNSMCLITV